ncbi:MAG: ribosomal L7Ae/L30e/S12e/Gadd45 family protein [Bacillota bacterium]|nr:ribosomal L7Ae/L30e/S12e/Gadd45 family protein [Bacillota bacterium]MDI7249330.1 ribosomal L7Ae/L30e/S12e/Gadd45 family protein [Bacillota bacterium]
MSLEDLKTARRRTVGTKQTLRAVEKGNVLCVFVARDAEPHVVSDLMRLCQEKDIPVEWVETMALLGKTCGIHVEAASAAILK